MYYKICNHHSISMFINSMCTHQPHKTSHSTIVPISTARRLSYFPDGGTKLVLNFSHFLFTVHNFTSCKTQAKIISASQVHRNGLSYYSMWETLKISKVLQINQTLNCSISLLESSSNSQSIGHPLSPIIGWYCVWVLFAWKYSFFNDNEFCLPVHTSIYWYTFTLIPGVIFQHLLTVDRDFCWQTTCYSVKLICHLCLADLNIVVPRLYAVLLLLMQG